MRKTVGTLAVVATFVSAAALGQQPAGKPMTAEQYEDVMEKIDPIFDNIRKSAEVGGKTAAISADAKKLQPLLKEASAFWTQMKRSDAVDFSSKTLAAALNLEKIAAAGDAAKATAAVKELGLACRACHTEYREKAPDGSYRMKKLS